jgi:acetyl-CoA C-acetyltransferase
MTLRDTAAIVGVAELAPVRTPEPGATAVQYFLRVAHDAIVDSGLGHDDIDGLMIAPTFEGAPLTASAMMADTLRLKPSFCDVVDLGGATTCGMIWRAAAAIAAGHCRAVLCLLAEVADQTRPPRMPMWDGLPGSEWDRPFGPFGPNSGYALIAMRHAHEFGTTDAQRAKVAVDQRTNACANPKARFHGQPITIDDVLASPLVVDPLHLLEIVMPCSGASAFVVARPDVARDGPHPAVMLRGAGEQVTHSSSYPKDLVTSGIAGSAARAWAMAGARPADVDMVSVYDCYTITVLVTLEDAGFCAKGQGGPFVAEHDLTWRGDLPCNTHGGQLSYGQPGLAGGATHVTEAVLQLRGEAGERQVADCGLAFVNGNGGIMSEQCSLVLERAS